MSRASARRSGTNCGRSSRCNLVSATCSAASAPRTFPASCSCWLASISTCSTSVSAHSSRDGESSRYSASSADCCACDSPRRFSRSAILACASRTFSWASLTMARVACWAASISARRFASSTRNSRCPWRASSHAAAIATAITSAATHAQSARRGDAGAVAGIRGGGEEEAGRSAAGSGIVVKASADVVDCSRTAGRSRPGWPGSSRSTRMFARPPSACRPAAAAFPIRCSSLHSSLSLPSPR